MEDGSGVRTRTWTVRRPPLSPPAGVAPFAGAGFPCSLPLPGGFAVGPANLLPGGRAPGTPTFARRAVGARWARGVGARWRATGAREARGGGGCWGRVIAGLRRPFLSVHRLHFTDSHETDTDFRVTNGLYVTLRSFAYGTFRRSVAYGGGGLGPRGLMVRPGPARRLRGGLGWSPGRRPMWGRRTARRPAGFPAAAPPPAWPAARSRCHISGTARTTGNRPGTRSS